jgi:3-deoxy-D-manno-octulosonic-acid transferase
VSSAGNADWRYRAITTLAAPLLAGYSLWQGWQAHDPRLARQRLGLGLRPRNDRPLWVHMSSVGEVNAAAPLIAAIRQALPDLPVLVTTFTPTGATNARERLGAEIEHVYLPLDLRHAVRRFLHTTQPRCALIMETEIWPRLFAHCRAEGIPLLIVNGRLSGRTLDRPAWIRAILGQALASVDRILARSARDAEGFRALGAGEKQVEVIDNLKFARPASGVAPRAPIRLPRPYVVAASTHDDEELQIARAWLASDLRDSHLLVIVPRHPRRKQAILEKLRPLGARLAVRSDGEAVDRDTEIHLADTFGELPGFIAGADLVFIGGSLIPRGGQNVIEVARAGKPALFGPHMENFADERDLLLDNDAALAVVDADALIRAMTDLLHDAERRRAIGDRARALVESRGDVVGRYLDAIAPWLDVGSDPRQYERRGGHVDVRGSGG